MRIATVTASDEKIEVFGPYEVYERIGVGGMASVHRAKKQGIEGFERVVALKRMLSHLADDQTFINSFVREARLASQLQHANIIQIYDLGRVDRVYYIAMEFVRGQDLRRLLKQTAYATGPMPVAMMLTIVRQLCDALDYAHSLTDDSGEPRGIVHRDISPSNLLIAADGHLKIIDFGIAKAISGSLRTLSGRVKGKFAYMAPEAILAKPLDNRSDIFSMGIVAHELLTARPLFASRSQFETIRMISQDEVARPSRYNPECPPELDDIILTALAKTPEERWQTAGAMHRALDHVAKRHGLQATNREIAEWVDWAFQQPLQSKRVSQPKLFKGAAASESPAAPAPAASPATGLAAAASLDAAAALDADAPDADNIEMAWGSRQDDARKRPSAPRLPLGAPAAAEPATVPMTQSDDASGPVIIVQREGSEPVSLQPAPAAPLVPGRDAAAPDEQSRPNAVSAGSKPASKSGSQSTMLGMAPPPERLSQRVRNSGAAAGGQAGAGRAGAGQAGGTKNGTRQPLLRTAIGYSVAKRTSPPRKPTVWGAASPLRIALVAMLCIGAAAGGYIAVRGWPGRTPAASPPASVVVHTAPADAGPPPDAPPADAAPPDAVLPLRKPADGSPLDVPADRVTLKSGKPPRVRTIHLLDDSGNPVIVRARLCISPRGRVTSVTVTDAPEVIHPRVQRALEDWRYEPFLLDGEALDVCFEVTTGLRDH